MAVHVAFFMNIRVVMSFHKSSALIPTLLTRHHVLSHGIDYQMSVFGSGIHKCGLEESRKSELFIHD